MTKLPSQADVVDKWFQERKCLHIWRFVGFSHTKQGKTKEYVCAICGKPMSERLPPLTTSLR